MSDARSPLAPLIGGLGLLLLVAALVTRTLTSGGGIELLQPGAQVLFDALLLSGAAAVLLGRGLAGQGLPAPRGALAAAGACGLVVLVAAARAEHADLAWRTALSWGGLLLLVLVAHGLGRERDAGRALAGVVVALVACAAGLALWQRFVEHPELVREYTQGGLEGELGHLDASYRQAMHERIHSPEAAGPFLLPALLACAAGMVLPLLLTLTWAARSHRVAGPALVAVTAAVVAAAAQTRSKGGALAVAAALGGLALLHPRAAPWRRRALLALGAAGGLLLALGLVAWARDPDAEGVGLSLAVRLEYWSAGLAIARDHPLLGAGLNQFRELYPAYKAVRAEETLHAHNAVVQVLAEAGAAGLAAGLGLLVVWARAGLRGLDARDRAPAAPADAAAGAPEGAADRAAAFVLGGLWLGLFLVGAFGDAYSFATPVHLAVLAVTLPAATALGAWAAGAAPPRLLAAAALAGAGAFLADGLLDFGLHHVGTATVAAVVVGLGVAWAAPPDAAHVVPREATLGMGLGAGGLALVLLAVVVPGALDADLARARAAEARDLDEAAADLAAATEAYPWHARTWLMRAAVEARRGRLEPARRAAEEAVARAPRSASAWSDLGAIRLQAGDEAGGRAALEEAVARYPGDPGHRLTLGLALARDPTRAAAAGEALEAALVASAAVRQVARQLTAEQVLVAARAHAGLGDAARARAAARRALALDDAVRAERAAGRAGPRPPLGEAERREALRLAE